MFIFLSLSNKLNEEVKFDFVDVVFHHDVDESYDRQPLPWWKRCAAYDAGLRRSALADVSAGTAGGRSGTKRRERHPYHLLENRGRTICPGEGGKPIQGNDGNPLKEKMHLERPRSVISYVFNAEQIEGLPLLVADKERTWEDVQRSEKILEASGAKVVHRAQGNAFYKPGEDAIYLPEKQQFSSEQGYYSTALHELAYWTGHESRLHREFGPFGSVTYAKEELRAEIGSMMLRHGCDSPPA